MALHQLSQHLNLDGLLLLHLLHHLKSHPDRENAVALHLISLKKNNLVSPHLIPSSTGVPVEPDDRLEPMVTQEDLRHRH